MTLSLVCRLDSRKAARVIINENTYFLEGCTPEALEELGLIRNIQGDEDRLFILDTVLLCMLGQKAKIGTNGEISPHSRVYLLFDEAEHVLAL